MKANKKLQEIGIEFEKIMQDKPTRDCEEAARERGLETSQIVKSLIVEREGEKVHACIPGDRELSEAKFGDHHLVSPEKSKEITGLESGTVHPLATDLRHFLDERILEKDRVSHTTGSLTEAIAYDPGNLIEAFDTLDIEFQVDDYVVSTDEDIQEIKLRGIEEKNAKFIVKSGHRKIFLKLSENHPPELVYDLIKEMERDEIEFEQEEAYKILKNSESQTHMQKMVQEFSETGEVNTGDEEFDLEEVVDQVISFNPNAVEDYGEGTDSALNYLLGQIMQETSGRAEGGKARKMLEEKLDD